MPKKSKNSYELYQYYWVITINSGSWKPAQYLGNDYWQVFGNHQTIRTDRLAQVGEKIPGNQDLFNIKKAQNAKNR